MSLDFYDSACFRLLLQTFWEKIRQRLTCKGFETDGGRAVGRSDYTLLLSYPNLILTFWSHSRALYVVQEGGLGHTFPNPPLNQEKVKKVS